MSTDILGISAYYHDSAAALIRDGRIVAAAQEERFSRRKHDASFPRAAVEYCLREAGVNVSQLDAVAFYEKPFLKFERLLETYLAFAPRGLRSFTKAMPVWLKEKLFLKRVLKSELAELAAKNSLLPRLLFTEHHLSHAASAFYPSPFRRAAVLCLDGVGEWATTTLWRGEDTELTPVWEIDFPHSLGLFYSAFTYFTGFKVNSGEYKLMGLAPYGEPRYVDAILTHLLDLKEDGTFRLNMKYFDYATGLTMTNSSFDRLFGGPPRKPEGALTQREMDIARSIQEVTNEVVLRLARTAHRELGLDCLCLAGGVALNCVANGQVLKSGLYRDIWIQPAASDAGGALGAALAVWHLDHRQPRNNEGRDLMQGSLLGPRFSEPEIRSVLDQLGAVYQRLDESNLMPLLAELLEKQKVIGWFQGRMEFGPRALGARSILADPRNPKMQSLMNLKIKFRESFRPFAPSVPAEKVSEYFDLDRPSPYMLLVAPVRENLRMPADDSESQLAGLGNLQARRSQLPAVTHVDFSARIQTVHAETNPRFHRLLQCFQEKAGCAVVVNTSFNVRGEPIVCTPAEAFACFMRTQMDYLVLENFLLSKADQPLARGTAATPGGFEPD